MRNIFRVMFLGTLLFFAYGFMYLGLYFGALVILGIGAILFFITMPRAKRSRIKAVAKKALKDMEQGSQDIIEVAGDGLKITADVTGRMLVQGGKAVAHGVEAAYEEMGGTEGAKKAVKKLGKATEEVMKVGGTAALALVEATSNAVEDVSQELESRRKEKERKKLKEKKPSQIEDVIENFKKMINDN
ncbi:MAG: hypothetical protein FWD87_10420 [Spirochaetaceae bacterium]|nr:hypothetical protein [Spirochaetaceae bacterium]